jgi:uncharacterized membrane protein
MRIGNFLKKVMRSSERSSPASVRILFAAVWTLLYSCVLAAPILAARGCESAATLLYLFFSPVCHQIPERSFQLCGHAWAVCHRCAGIYFGFLLAAVVGNPFLGRRSENRRRWVLAAGIPLLVDALAPFTGLWHSNAHSRFASGVPFGYVASSLLVLGAAEWLHETLRRVPMRCPHLKGGLS